MTKKWTEDQVIAVMEAVLKKEPRVMEIFDEIEKMDKLPEGHTPMSLLCERLLSDETAKQ